MVGTMQVQPMPLSAEEKSHLQAHLLNAVEQAVLAVDLEGHIVFWNRFAETLYGWAEEEVQGRNITDVLASPLLMESARANLRQMQHGEDWSGEFPVQRRDGTTFKASISASLIQSTQRALISMVGISHNGTEHQQLQEANRLLAEAAARLADAVDYELPLTTLAQLAVPQLADWCAVHMVQGDGSIEQVALAPSEIEVKQVSSMQAAYDWLQNYLTNDESNGLPAVLRSGEPKLVTDAVADRLATMAMIKSYMIVPLITHPQTFGAITFVAAESGRRFDQNALALAENLVSHIAIYLDKARLYQESQRLNSELEQRVNERTVELSTAVVKLKQSESTIQTLFRISTELNATLEVDTILDELAKEAIKIVDGESGFAGLRTADGMTVSKYFSRGITTPFEYTWAVGQGIPGWVLQYKIPYGTKDAAHRASPSGPQLGHR